MQKHHIAVSLTLAVALIAAEGSHACRVWEEARQEAALTNAGPLDIQIAAAVMRAHNDPSARTWLATECPAFIAVAEPAAQQASDKALKDGGSFMPRVGLQFCEGYEHTT